jgi:hypothetical protein
MSYFATLIYYTNYIYFFSGTRLFQEDLQVYAVAL